MKYIKYLKYVLIHKYYIYEGGRKLALGLWQILTHDMSKFFPSEFFAYARYFYGNNGSMIDFNYAWNHHQKYNKHHWQYWVLTMDDGKVIALEMPEKYVKEMVVDWYSAGKAKSGKNEVEEWYNRTRLTKTLHPDTRDLVETYIIRLNNTAY